MTTVAKTERVAEAVTQAVRCIERRMELLASTGGAQPTNLQRVMYETADSQFGVALAGCALLERCVIASFLSENALAAIRDRKSGLAAQFLMVAKSAFKGVIDADLVAAEAVLGAWNLATEDTGMPTAGTTATPETTERN